jgi:hypothetical protein
MELPPGFRYIALAFIFLSSLLLMTHAQAAPINCTTGTCQVTCILTPGQVTTPDSCIFHAFPLMAIGILLSFLIIAIVYVLGNVINFRTMQNWYMAELWETVKTLILLGVIVAALVMLSAVADVLVGVPQAQVIQPLSGTAGALGTNLAGLYGADSTYLAQQLNGSYQSYAAVLGLDTGIGILKSLSLSLWIPIPIIPPVIIGSVQFGSTEQVLQSNFITSNPGESAYSITQNIIQLVVVPMLIAFQFQSTYFYDLVTFGLGILIPIGVIFRAFPLVRNIGGTLIATGIGLALVYPALLLIVNLPVSNYIYAFTYSQSLNNNCPFSSGLMCEMWSAVINVIAQPSTFAGLTAGVATAGLTTASSAFVTFPLTLALGSAAAGNANVVDAEVEGFGVGLGTPLTSTGIYPSLNFIIDNTLGMILQLILLGIDIMFGLIITGAITDLLGGKVRLGFGSKLSLTRTG